MISFGDYKQMYKHNTPGRARKAESDNIMLNTWWEDIQSQTAYIYDYYHDMKSDEAFKLNDLHPQEDEQKTALPIKFIRHQKQTYDKDQVTFWLQMQPGQQCNLDYYDDALGKRYETQFPIAVYVDVMQEDGTYNKWLVVDKANYNGNQFPTFEILRCDKIFQWVHKGKKYQCAGVLRSQNSQIVRFIKETLCRKFSNCWENLLGYQYLNGDNLINRVNQQRSLRKQKRSTSKVRQVPENGNHLSLLYRYGVDML